MMATRTISRTRAYGMNTKNNKPTTNAPPAVLVQFDRLRAILAETHSQIPALLQRQRDLDRAAGLNESAESRAKIADVVQQRQAATRRRGATIASIMDMEPVLQAEREALEAARREYAGQAVQAFQERYSAAVGELQALWEEGRVLAATLRCAVPMPMPTTVVVSVVDGIGRSTPILADVTVTVDAGAATLGAALDRLDEALSLCNAIRQGAEQEARHHQLAVNRGTASEYSGVYKVLEPFRSQLDGLEFAPGELVDSSLLGAGMMSRLQTGRRYIAPVGMEAA